MSGSQRGRGKGPLLPHPGGGKRAEKEARAHPVRYAELGHRQRHRRMVVSGPIAHVRAVMQVVMQSAHVLGCVAVDIAIMIYCTPMDHSNQSPLLSLFFKNKGMHFIITQLIMRSQSIALIFVFTQTEQKGKKNVRYNISIVTSFQEGSSYCPYYLAGIALLGLCVRVRFEQLSHPLHG